MFADYAANQATDATLEKYYGKYPGVVIDDTGNSAYPLTEHERMRGELWVRVPGILEEPPDDNSPDGAAPQGLEVIAKPCFPPGFFYVPEPGAHVWVEFAAGDINTPIWSGVWYPNNAIPPTVSDSTPTRAQKVIRTGSGHVVQIDDTDGEEKVVIQHKSGAQISLDPDGSLLLANGKKAFLFLNAKNEEVTVFDTHKNLFTMKADGVTLGIQGGFIEMKDGKMKVTCDETMQISGKNVVINASSVSLGGELAKFSMLVAELFLAQFDTHTHGHPLGPTLPPIMPLTPQAKTLTAAGIKITPAG